MRILSTLLLASLIFEAAVDGQAPSNEHRPRRPGLTLEDCTFPEFERTARCGTLTVAENPQEPGGREIDLHLIVLPARSGRPRADAVTYLVGGPGQAATTSVSFFGDSLRGIQEHHDLVLVDQRGTGRSNPLDCALSMGEMAKAILGGGIAVNPLTVCVENLDADPRFYTTPFAMDDLEAVREALGYDRWHLIGVSYGTRAALVYSRRYPDRVASMVLRGVTSPNDNIPWAWLRGGDRAIGTLFTLCASDAQCRTAYPDLENRWTQILRTLEERPAPLAVGDERVELRLTPELFVGALQLLLYSDRGVARAPAWIQAAAGGDLGPFQKGLNAILGQRQGLHLGMYLSVLCSEDLPFLDLDSAVHETWTYQRPQMLQNLAKTCQGWPRGSVPDTYKDPVSSTVPTLLLSGSLDPATPPSAAEDAARTLPNSLHQITPGLGHHPSWTSCFARTATALIDGTPIQEIDGTCAQDEQGIVFYVPRANALWLAAAALLGLSLWLALRRFWRRAQPLSS